MSKRVRLLIFIVMVIIGFVLILYGFNVNISDLFKNVNWITWFTFITLIYTIFRDSNERNKSIESATLSNNQLEFEKRLYDVLNVYNELISESSVMFFDTSLTANKIMIPLSTTFKFKDMPIKYRLKFSKMKDDIYYFYREVESVHPVLDNLINDIESLNKKLMIELKKYMNLAIKSIELSKDSIDEMKKIELYKELNSERTSINSNILNLINDNKESIYNNARLCIRERMRIIKEKGI